MSKDRLKREHLIGEIKKLFNDPELPEDERDDLITNILDCVSTKNLSLINDMKLTNWTQM